MPSELKEKKNTQRNRSASAPPPGRPPNETARNPAHAARLKKEAAARRRKKENKQTLAAAAILLLAFYLVISLLFAALLYFSFNSSPQSAKLYSLVLYKDEKKLKTIAASDANNTYGLYISYTDFNLITDVSMAGSGDEMTFILVPSGDAIKCTNNSSLIYINANAIRLSSPVLYDSSTEECLFPIEIIEYYILGIDIQYDEEKLVCSVSRDSTKVSPSLIHQLPDGLPQVNIPEGLITNNPIDESSDTSSN